MYKRRSRPLVTQYSPNVARTNVVDLASFYKIVQSTESLLQRCTSIPRMALKHVNVLDTEAGQRLVNTAHKVMA